LDGKSFTAQIRNVDFDARFKRIKDTLQIRYPRNGELARALQASFIQSYHFFLNQRQVRAQGDRTMIRLPKEIKEYLAIYTTAHEDTYVFETITTGEIDLLKQVVKNQSERLLESNLDLDILDTDSHILEDKRVVKIWKLNRKIGDNLKLLYGYRCQICGQIIGEQYGAHAIEAHHIDYFVSSLNNDTNNQLIVCPNHHSIIHELNPIFDRIRLVYRYPNGIQEGLAINQHLHTY
jgi:predicted HNH restriction endonuclease